MRRTTALNEAWSFTCASWQKPPGKIGCSTLESRPAQVPGQVHLDLIANGIIADPFASCHELGCQWVDLEDFCYSRSFDYSPSKGRYRCVLRFDGLDTVCRVYLNERLMAEHDNMFVPLEVDVTLALVPGQNQLRVEFDAAVRVGKMRREAYFAAQGISENTVRFDARAFVRKAQYMYGWDWGPSLVSAGIYRPVSLIEYAARLLDVHIEQRHNGDGSVSIRCLSEIESVGKDDNVKAYHFVEGFDAPLLDGEWFRIESPRLWWPHGMGDAALYLVTSALLVSAPRSRTELGSALDLKEQKIGLRELTVRRDPDAFGRSFCFVVNGRDCYALGANWIPDDSFASRVDVARLRAQLSRAIDLEMNMLRVWGGGFYETCDFYDLCDELGLLVWQDFPFACSYYPDDENACRALRCEATSNIKRLRNRASLAIWCGNNENQAMRDDRWDGADRQPVRFEGERLYREVLPAVLTELDPGRVYIEGSPFGEGRANSGTDGDQHYWDVWHGRGDWCFYKDSDARFCSEFGFASAPGHATWLAMEPTRNLLEADCRDPVARWHDKTAKGYETFVGLVELHYPASSTIEEWTYRSQLNQRDALRFGIEHYRRSEYCRGALIWQLNDCWPVQSWAVIDSLLHYKAAAFELRRLYAPLLASVERDGDRIYLWGILDNVGAPKTAEFALELRRLSDGNLLSCQSQTVTIRPGERTKLLELGLDGVPPTDCIAVANVDNRPSYRLLVEPKELSLAAPSLSIEQAAGVLTVSTTTPVVDLCLWDEAGRAVFLDNFLSQIEPGQVRLRFRYRGEITKIFARSLGGRHEVILHKPTA